MKRYQSYGERIIDAIAGSPWSAAAPEIVECWMRCEYGTLDHLSGAKFRTEALVAAKLTIDHPEDSKLLAASYGVKVAG